MLSDLIKTIRIKNKEITPDKKENILETDLSA